jgi:hypothetical protein
MWLLRDGEEGKKGERRAMLQGTGFLSEVMKVF